MANFNMHIGTAACMSIGGSLLVYTSGCITEQQSILLALSGSLGGILPDMDSDNSTSIKLIFRLVAACISVILLFNFLPNLGLILALPCAIFSFFIIIMPVRSVFEKFTVHRGIFHSIPMGVLLGLSTTLICILLGKTLLVSWAMGLFILFGFIIHLSLDEIYSVDLSGLRLKRSFGTALKLGTKDNLKLYILIYLSIVTLVFFLKEHLPVVLFDHKEQDIIWHNFTSNLWPHVSSVNIVAKL